MTTLVISYARVDQPLVRSVVKLLRAYGEIDAAVYWDEDLEPGGGWFSQITNSIDAAPKLFVFWCAHSAASEQVSAEMTYAIEAGKRVVPILLDDTSLDPKIAKIHGVDLRSAVAHGSTLSRDVRAWATVAAVASAVVVAALLFTSPIQEPAQAGYGLLQAPAVRPASAPIPDDASGERTRGAADTAETGDRRTEGFDWNVVARPLLVPSYQVIVQSQQDAKLRARLEDLRRQQKVKPTPKVARQIESIEAELYRLSEGRAAVLVPGGNLNDLYRPVPEHGDSPPRLTSGVYDLGSRWAGDAPLAFTDRPDSFDYEPQWKRVQPIEPHFGVTTVSRPLSGDEDDARPSVATWLPVVALGAVLAYGVALMARYWERSRANRLRVVEQFRQHLSDPTELSSS